MFRDVFCYSAVLAPLGHHADAVGRLHEAMQLIDMFVTKPMPCNAFRLQKLFTKSIIVRAGSDSIQQTFSSCSRGSRNITLRKNLTAT
jgi:hypothetical protein